MSTATRSPAQRRAPSEPAPPVQRGAPGEPGKVAYLYLAPAFVVFACFLAWPLLRALWLSLYEWDGLSRGVFVGLDNYREVVTNPDLRQPFVHSLVLLVWFSVLPIVLGLVLAWLMTRNRLKGNGFFRTVLFLPQVVAMVVVGIAWRQIYAPSGPLNDALSFLGLGGLREAWLGDSRFALSAVGLVGTWVGTGLCTVLFLAGLSRVPKDLYEAAALDGAGSARTFLSIALPALRGEIAVAVTLTVVAAMRTFDLVYVMTTGGPGTSTRVPSYEVWRWSLQDGRVGYGVTIALVLTALIMALTVAVNRLAERDA